MNREKVWEDFAALPVQAQQQVADFIAFLRIRYSRPSQEQKTSPSDLTDETFIGMWRDRAEMEESSLWVRGVRRREWM